MPEYTEPQPEQTSTHQSKGNVQQQKSKIPAVEFEDNRPDAIAQRRIKALADNSPNAQPPVQPQKNNTGLPDQLKSGIENLSGHSMDDVKVHYNSGKPAQLNAHAYAQGNQIHVAPGQEKHLPHEAWHVVQQKQGRVKPTMQLKEKVPANDDAGLEKEADVMGRKAIQTKISSSSLKKCEHCPTGNLVQRVYAPQTYSGNRTLHVDHHTVNWGGAPQNGRIPRNGNRAILFETISNSTPSVQVLMGRLATTGNGNAIWDVGLTVALNSFYVPQTNNTDDTSGQSLNRTTTVPTNQRLANVQTNLDNQRTTLLNAWNGPPINITTVAWERRFQKPENQNATLESARGNVPFTSLRKLAARNTNAAAIATDLANNRNGTVWRKMGDDDMPIPDPNGNSEVMDKLEEAEGNIGTGTAFVTFGYNLTTGGVGNEMAGLLRTVYWGEMSLRQALSDLGVKTYPIEPNTFYKFNNTTNFDNAWGRGRRYKCGGRWTSDQRRATVSKKRWAKC